MTLISNEEYMNATNNDEGWCTSCCAFTADNVEPDAENYRCQSCDEYTVYGAEQALLRGFIDVAEE